jgi:ribosomal protein S18 acetylase RimI-like enzyme
MAELRPSSVDDPAAHALLEEYFLMRAATFPGGPYTTVFPSADAFAPPAGVFLLVIDDAGNAVGCGGIRALPDGPRGPRYEVKHLYLAPEARGHGWGRMLLAELEREARALGATELVLDTHHTLEAAGRLYAAAGFVQTAPYNDNPNATRWYAKEL